MLEIKEETLKVNPDDKKIYTSFQEEGWRLHHVSPIYKNIKDKNDVYQTVVEGWKAILYRNTTTKLIDTFLLNANYGFDHQRKIIIRPFKNAWRNVKDNFNHLKNSIKFR